MLVAVLAYTVRHPPTAVPVVLAALVMLAPETVVLTTLSVGDVYRTWKPPAPPRTDAAPSGVVIVADQEILYVPVAGAEIKVVAVIAAACAVKSEDA